MDVALPALPPKGWDGGGGDAAAFNMDSIEERMRTMKAEFEEAVLEREEGLQDIADVDGADQNGLLEPGRFGAASRPESESAGTHHFLENHGIRQPPDMYNRQPPTDNDSIYF